MVQMPLLLNSRRNWLQTEHQVPVEASTEQGDQESDVIVNGDDPEETENLLSTFSSTPTKPTPAKMDASGFMENKSPSSPGCYKNLGFN